MGDPARQRDERFTYRHYRTWPDGERWELIEGHAWSMSPAPKTRHQTLAGALYSAIRQHLKGKPCRVFIAPFDVLLPKADEADDEVDTVVQPDIVVFCDRSKLTEAGARGAPDFVVEILSPSSSRKDLNEKFRLYESRGVREYWVIDPGNRSLLAYRLDAAGEGPERAPGYGEGELRERLVDWSPLASAVLEGFVLDPEELFAELD